MHVTIVTFVAIVPTRDVIEGLQRFDTEVNSIVE